MKRFKDDRILLEKDFKHLNKQKQLKHHLHLQLHRKMHYKKMQQDLQLQVLDLMKIL